MIKQITQLASSAIDTLVDKSGKALKTQPGGPALYLDRVFDQESISYDKISPETLNVEILITPDKELGKISQEVTEIKPKYEKITTPFLVISTVLNEISLDGLDKYSGQTFLDVQGYVRDGSDFGKKKFWKPASEIANSLFCLKGTEEELSYLPKEFTDNQKQKLLIVTKGEKGCDVYFKSQKYQFKPSNRVKPINTIGAGDTFFAYFINNFIRTNDPVKSTETAVNRTQTYLLNSVVGLEQK